MSTDAGRRDRAMETVYAKIDRARASWRTLEMLDGLVKTVIACGIGLIAALWADNLLHLSAGVRLALGIALLALLAVMLLRFVFYPLLRTLTDEMVAAHVERALPDLDNRLINAVLLYNERYRDSLTRLMADSQLDHAARSVSERSIGPRGETRTLWRHGRLLLMVLAVLGLYALFFSGYLANAFARILRPYDAIAPITDTRLDVRPGDATVLQGDSLPVEARVSGLLPSEGRVLVYPAGGEDTDDVMAFEGNAFTYRFRNVQDDFSYRIRAGDALTPRYRVEVRSRPAVQNLSLTYSYPAYTGLDERTEENATGDIGAPIGTDVRLAVRTDTPVRSGRIETEYLSSGSGETAPTSSVLPLTANGEGSLQAELSVERSGRYTIHLEDAHGVPNLPEVRNIEAVPDGTPRVHFIEPGEDVAAPPESTVTLLAAAEDDFGLRGLYLFVQRRAGADWERLRGWEYDTGARVSREGAVLDLAELELALGDTLAYYMQANDGLRRGDDAAGRSRVYHVRVVDPAEAESRQKEARAALAELVRKLISLQRDNLQATRNLEGWARLAPGLTPDADKPKWDEFHRRADALVTAEEKIQNLAAGAAEKTGEGDAGAMAEALVRIAAGPVAEAVDLLKELRAVQELERIQPNTDPADRKMIEIIAFLEDLLENPRALLAKLAREQDGDEGLSERLDEMVTGKELAEKLLKSLKDFREDQKRIIEMTNQLGEKPVDDFTDEDEKKLKEIVDAQKEWTEFFQEAATDLSKLPPQDHSLSTQAKEFLEVYSEVQQAAEDAERKQIELAVPHEQAGLELAESIETNIEKWLMEDKDNLLWSMEEPLDDVETPMVELPDELQDLIGDLVEQEEDMLEEFDDITSGWMDSLDIGAGWDAQDGPISNMSAKGVTGNRLPNTSEIGGRSGEGRTGKSSGQFVEQDATGKGGRQTPSRLTADPFEAGWVNDTSGEAPTGATGGGKVSGQGAEGFQGPIPPALKQELNRMVVRQQDLIDKARRIDYGLQKYRAPRGRLPEAIELMEAQKAGLEQGDLANFGSYQRVVLSNLREVKELTEKQKQIVRDRSALLPKELREEISSGLEDEVPEQYREMVRNYFRALSEGGEVR